MLAQFYWSGVTFRFFISSRCRVRISRTKYRRTWTMSLGISGRKARQYGPTLCSWPGIFSRKRAAWSTPTPRPATWHRVSSTCCRTVTRSSDNVRRRRWGWCTRSRGMCNNCDCLIAWFISIGFSIRSNGSKTCLLQCSALLGRRSFLLLVFFSPDCRNLFLITIWCRALTSHGLFYKFSHWLPYCLMCILCVHLMCASHVCISCVHLMCASHVCISCVHLMCASHVCISCVHLMCASHVCISCVHLPLPIFIALSLPVPLLLHVPPRPLLSVPLGLPPSIALPLDLLLTSPLLLPLP